MSRCFTSGVAAQPVERRLRDRGNQWISAEAFGFQGVARALAQGMGGEQDISLCSPQSVNAHVDLKNTQHISQLEYRAKLTVLCGRRLGLKLWHLDQIVRKNAAKNLSV